MENVIYLGCSTFTSKKNGTTYWMIHLAREFDQRFGIGYRAESFYCLEADYKAVCDCKPFSKVQADIRYINGRDALISISK